MRDTLIMSKKELRCKSIFDLVRAGVMTQQAASKRLSLSYRQTKRRYQSYLKDGDLGLIHKNRGKVSPRAKPPEMKRIVLSLYEAKYWDFGPTLAAEKLCEEDGYRLHAETLRTWLKEAGIWHPRRKRKVHRTRRARRSRFGELLQLDGSIHAWFSGIPDKQCLMNLVDDATGKTLALMATGETTEAAFRLLKWWIELHGIPMAIYVDLKSLYISPKSLRYNDEDDLVEPEWLTHFSKACKALGIDVIKAYSPQAKGRVERSHGVYQDRFVKELRLKGITTIEEANKCLRNGFVDTLNRKFMKTSVSQEDAHVALMAGQHLKDILCWEYTRVVQNDWTVRFENRRYQIPKSARHIRPKYKLKVKKHLNGKPTLWYKGKQIPHHLITHEVKQQLPEKQKLGHDPMRQRQIARANKHKTPWSQFNPNWLKKTVQPEKIPT